MGTLIVVTTPSVIFLGASVNLSGLEIAAAMCLWTAGALLVVGRRRDPPPALVAAAGAAAVLASTRPLSTRWLLVIALVLACAAWRRVPLRR